MISGPEFIAFLEKQIVPPEPPATMRTIQVSPFIDFRSECTDRGMWALVYEAMAHQLSTWIDGRLVLEVMAGRGWLAKALEQCGVNIIATDNHSWDKRHSKRTDVTAVLPVEAIEAVQVFTDRQILIMSWPYMDDTAYNVIKAWGADRPVIYIGESYGGCTASDTFFQHFVEIYPAPRLPLVSWSGIHDSIRVGHYSSTGRNECIKCGAWAYDGDLCYACEEDTE